MAIYMWREKAYSEINITTYDVSGSDAGITITVDGVSQNRKWNTLNDGGTGSNHYEDDYIKVYMDSSGNNYYVVALTECNYNGNNYTAGQQIATWRYNVTVNMNIYEGPVQ